MGKLIYLPVISSKSGFSSVNDKDGGYAGKDLGWWMDDPILSYDAVLMSAYYGIDSYQDRKDLDMREDVCFFGDSGGFQVYNLGKDDPKRRAKIQEKLHPKKVIDWQQSVCDVGMTLDLPLPEFHGYSEQTFQHHMQVSKDNGDLMRENHTNKDFQLFSVVHGKDLHDLTRWHEGTTADHDFDGFSLDAGNTKTVAMDLGFAMEHLDGAPFHILGAAGMQAIILMAYANKFMDTDLYFDSSTYTKGSQFRVYINPFDVAGSGLRLGDGSKEINCGELDRLENIFCPCPVCQNLESIDHLWETGTRAGVLISLHNLSWLNTYTAFVENWVKNEDAFNSYVRKFALPSTLKYIEFLDGVHEHGLDWAWNKYFEGNTQKINDWM